jgi:short subunit dehydrogenase-like uncharacterized protein
MLHSSRASLVCAIAAAGVLLLVLFHRPVALSPQDAREFDLIIFGATGYVGTLLTAMLLDDRAPFLSVASGVPLTPGVGGLRFALAGRNAAKLRQLRQHYADRGVDVSGVEIAVADLADPSSLDRLAARTRVVLTTVAILSVYETGRFEYEGSLLERCIRHGTHLVDLDGELWIDDVKQRRRVDAAARASGTVYGPACGEVAAVPDMAVYHAWVHLGRVPLKSAEVHHFYFDGRNEPAPKEDASVWEAYDAPLLRLSAAALGYGPAFTFSERSATNAAHADFAKNKNEDVRAVAAFVTAADVESADGRKVTTRITGGEIDYEDTARLAMAMALSLIRDDIPAKRTGGVWSPAAGWGDVLLRRLEAIGLGVSLAPQGATAASIMRNARERYHGRYVAG